VNIVRLPGFTHCTYSYNTTPSMASYREIPRFILGTSLLILAVIPTLKQSIEMYNSTHHCQIDFTMTQLIREGVLYFVVYVSLSISFTHPNDPLTPGSSSSTSTSSSNHPRLQALSRRPDLPTGMRHLAAVHHWNTGVVRPGPRGAMAGHRLRVRGVLGTGGCGCGCGR
ncbi:hypothetical protein OG21DRAFT_1508370, partial [Imleria badia]